MKPVSYLLLIASVAAAIAGGSVLLLGGPARGAQVQVILPTSTPAPAIQVQVKVYVTGAVRRPGVYTLAQGDRLEQALQAAGGPAEDADLEAVNLAARVRDEDHVHIPRQGEAPAGPASTASGATPSGRIDLNSATAQELVALPEIGEALAEAIVRYREAYGPFASVDELLEVQGIGPATLAAVRDLVEVR